jgi:hypothetical protein
MSRRTDSWESALTEDQQWRAYDRAVKWPWPEVIKWIAEEFKIDPPSRAGYYRWRRHMAERESQHRIEEALSVKKSVRRQMDAVGDMDQELEFAWEQLAMDSASRGDSEAGMRYLTMALKLRDSAMEREKIDLKRQADRLAAERLELDKREFEEALKTAIEKGLNALYSEIKGNAAAEKLVARLKAEVDEAGKAV